MPSFYCLESLFRGFWLSGLLKIQISLGSRVWLFCCKHRWTLPLLLPSPTPSFHGVLRDVPNEPDRCSSHLVRLPCFQDGKPLASGYFQVLSFSGPPSCYGNITTAQLRGLFREHAWFLGRGALLLCMRATSYSSPCSLPGALTMATASSHFSTTQVHRSLLLLSLVYKGTSRGRFEGSSQETATLN